MSDTNSIFKVPKNKSKDVLERVPLSSSVYLSDILPIIEGHFKNPFISQKKMEISSVWLINNASAEQRYINRRQIMRKTMPKISYYVGFMYINEFQKLRQIARLGKIEIGNINNSRLGTSSMGVSLSLFADIYHPGYRSTGMPNKGYLLLVKYLKGKINYVPCDDSPMDPQPQYDCHVVKGPVINNGTSSSNAFNQTQIFIYEYNDDGEIVKYPSKILPYAAVEFKWEGTPLFKMIAHVPRKPTMNENRMREIELSHFTVTQNEKHASTFSIHHKNATSVVKFELSLKDLPDVKMKANAYLYFTNPILSLLRSDIGWEISGVIECSEFEKEFKRLQVIWNDAICPASSKDLLDPLSQDVIISLNRPNLISSADVDSEAHCFNEFSNIPQFVSYTRISMESYEYSKRICNHLHLSKTMAFINRAHDPDISILLFPDGKLSKKLGIPSVSDVYYLHGLIFHAQHPQFIILKNMPEKRKEKDLYFSCLSAIKKQYIQSKLKSLEPLVDLQILKQTVKSQAEVQKAFLFKILKPHINASLIDYKPVCFMIDCDNFECIYHNPSKKMRLNESTNKENIGDADIVSDPLQPPIQKVKERHCLTEKLFDYFKNNSNPITEEEVEQEAKSIVDERISLSHTPHKISVSLNHSKAPPNEIHNQKSEVVNVAAPNNNGGSRKSTSHIKSSEAVRGSFLPIEFCSNSKARFSDHSGYQVIEFKHPASIGLFDANNLISKKLWSFHNFAQHSSCPGTSVFE